MITESSTRVITLLMHVSRADTEHTVLLEKDNFIKNVYIVLSYLIK